MFSRAIITHHTYLPVSEVDCGALRDELLAVRKYEGAPIPMYDDSVEGWFGVPRYHFVREPIAQRVVDRRSSGSPIEFQFRKDLWNAQLEVMAQFYAFREKGCEGFLIKAPPGFGKTVVFLKIIQMLGRTAIVVVPRSNLVEQWVEKITEFTTLRKNYIGIVNEAKCDYRGKSIVVGLVHSIALDRWGMEFKNYFGTAVFDEVDRSVPPTTFAPVMGMFPVLYRVGASAELKRADGLDVVFKKHIGQCTLVGRDENRMAAKVLRVEYELGSGYVYEGSARLNRRGMLISRLAKNMDRNRFVSYMTLLIVRSDRRTLVLSDRIEQLVKIKKCLLAYPEVAEQDVGFYAAKVPVNGREDIFRKPKAADLKAVADKCKIILATYGMMAIGTDIPTLAGLVQATPQSSTTQSRGRIERLFAGKKDPVLVDIIDTAYDEAVAWGRRRQAEYKQYGLKVKTVKRGEV